MEKLSAYLLAGSGPGEAARLLACKAKWADGWLGVIPGICSDTPLSNVAVTDSISLRLGLDVLDNGKILGATKAHPKFFLRS